jgi:hypothetical protein
MFFKSKPAGLTPRQRLVGDMQQSYPSVRAADAVGGAFELALRPSGVPMTLRIVLDATFPASRPGETNRRYTYYIPYPALLSSRRYVVYCHFFSCEITSDIQVYASVPISHPQIDPRTKQVINLPKVSGVFLCAQNIVVLSFFNIDACFHPCRHSWYTGTNPRAH